MHQKNHSASSRKQTRDDDIHNYAGKIRRLRRKLPETRQGDLAVRFLEKLKVSGLKDGRVCYYGDRLTLILKLFNGHPDGPVMLEAAEKHHCESVLSQIISNDEYGGETKKAYALALMRFVNYAKTGDVGCREDGYAGEVSWIRPSKYLDKNDVTVKSEDLLTADEITALLGAISNKRDRAMYWVLFEGAFRTGELLKFRIGGVDFRDDHVVVTTHGGKTGSKRIPLVLSFRPLLEWLAEHPNRNNPDAFLWCSDAPQNKAGRISYSYLRRHLKQYAEKAGIKKRIWIYLMRHTQLTQLAKKLSDQTLRAYGNWSPSSNMARKYVHLSGKDMDEAILGMHGIRSKNDTSGSVRLESCPRCDNKDTPDSQRCSKCGYILDRKLLPDEAKTYMEMADEMRAGLDRIGALEDKIDLLFARLLTGDPVAPRQQDAP